MKKFFVNLFLIVLVSFLGLAVGFCIQSYMDSGAIVFDLAYIKTPITLGLGVMSGLCYILLLLNKLSKSEGKKKSGAYGKDGKKVDQYYSSRFVTEKELTTQSKFMFGLYSELHTVKRDGIPLRAELRKGKTLVNMYKPIHTIIIGTTGSGKTTMIMNPTIQILSETASKPSLVISDPKGELYNLHSQALRNRGYEVHVVDLREPDKSSRWNPLERSYDNYQRAHNLEKEVTIHRNAPLKSYPKLTQIKSEKYNEAEWYEFNGVAYPNKQILDNDILGLKAKLISQAMEEITEISNTLCPIEGQDPSWSRGAQGFIKATLIAMLEDSLIPELKMTKEKFNFYNLTQICARRDAGDDQIETLRNYFQGRNPLSECTPLANTVVMNAPSTYRGFLGNVTSSLNMFSDNGICYISSGTDIDFGKFADRPSALFIKVPDEKDNRHALANMYITQLYTMLIERANKSEKIELPRNVYFLLDEFGNLPKIQKLKSFITAGRSRRIFLVLVVQDYMQLNAIYGENDAATIRNNCNIQIFIGTKDAKTREEFAKNAGSYQIEVVNSSKNEGKTKESSSSSTSTSYASKQLVDPNELDHLDLKKGEVIINIFPEYSIRSVFTPSYLNPVYKLGKPKNEYSPTHFLDKDKIFYDIAKRNAIIFKDNKNDDFDF